MRAVLQRVRKALVKADGAKTGEIGHGLVVFLGIEKIDTHEDLEWLCGKIPRIRCFEDGEGRMNRNLLDVGGGLMVISQFTLYGTLRKGTRPSFNRAAEPGKAIRLYEACLSRLEELTGQPVARGRFGAQMRIEAHNEGPVTLVIDTHMRDF